MLLYTNGSEWTNVSFPGADAESRRGIRGQRHHGILNSESMAELSFLQVKNPDVQLGNAGMPEIAQQVRALALITASLINSATVPQRFLHATSFTKQKINLLVNSLLICRPDRLNIWRGTKNLLSNSRVNDLATSVGSKFLLPHTYHKDVVLGSFSPFSSFR